MISGVGIGERSTGSRMSNRSQCSRAIKPEPIVLTRLGVELGARVWHHDGALQGVDPAAVKGLAREVDGPLRLVERFPRVADHARHVRFQPGPRSPT